MTGKEKGRPGAETCPAGNRPTFQYKTPTGARWIYDHAKRTPGARTLSSPVFCSLLKT